ncbi:discoidin domain-containing protein, partial [Erysipelatoclostridium sp. AM42-17]|uniref:discoidin domain-containing protein n=1 Tax=Erysipelatoclostridium sp. AM42-17 TaxID=2293102 RepID=UPI0018F7674C
MKKKKTISKYAACFLALNMAAEPITGLSMFRPSAIMAQQQDVITESNDPYLVSSNKEVTVSSVRGDATGDLATDGSDDTRWESDWRGDKAEWIKIDLKKETKITKIHLNWEGACASEYQIQISDDDDSWTNIKEVTDGKAGKIDFDFDQVTARFVRIYASKRAMIAYGVSLFEFQVYGFNGLYKVNLAQNKPVQASSLLDEWWMKDENGNIKPGETPDAKNAVDGNMSSRWRSGNDSSYFKENTPQWISVDLQGLYKIGQVNITYDGEAAATIYDLQVSNDGQNWQTVYRQLRGNNKKQKIRLTATGRYVRVLCRSKFRDAYIAIKELEIFRQMEDEKDVTHTIPDLPKKEVVSVKNSKATYNSNDIYFANQARYPEYIEDNLKNKPLASNDWWQSLVINETGNALSLLPLKVKYEPTKGLGLLTYSKSKWNKADDYTQGAVTASKSESTMAFYVEPSDFDDSQAYNKVSGYGDYHVSVNYYDANGLSMSNTFVKGSPYTYFDFHDKKTISLNINDDEQAGVTAIFFDEKGDILTEEGKITTDHIGIKTVTGDKTNYYDVNVPADTQFEKTDTGLKITIKDDDSYMSIGTMTDASQLNQFYLHGYAFVTDTNVAYDFDESTSKITSSYNLTTKVKRDGFTDQSYQCMFPHQWDKYASDQDLTKLNIIYDSPRGNLKLYDGNSFKMQDTFYGMVPEFTAPTNGEYDENELLSYLDNLDQGTQGNLVGSDAYWQGKSLHPLGMGVLVADQVGNTEYRDKFLGKMKTILTDWLTYSGEGDQAFFFYDKNWGTLYYKDSEFGANRDISDHHFTYGYFVFACSVLATYDDEFYQDYKEMIDLIVRDYASPDKNDNMFCRYRSFDPYEGHSWAGGYADNDDGNNQEAGSESLFGWVGAYLWATKREDKKMRDSAIFGFTTELNAVEHYWFNYYGKSNDGLDHSGWPEDWPSKIIGQTYGSSYFYGTFFGGYPTYIYGIHWCPVGEYISYYGVDKKAAANIYQGVIDDTNGQKAAHPEVTDYPDTLNSWQHIFLPFLSLSDSDRAMQELNHDTQSQAEGFNTYWFLNNMKDLGQRTTDICATGGVSSSVYVKEVDGKKQYQAMVWNPTDHDIEVTFKNSENKVVGNATIAAQSLLRLDPTQKDAVQTQKPTFSVESDTYDDTQYVKISSETKGATIHYTTDGSTPTTNSPVYKGRIAVSESTTIKAIAVKDDYINSSMNSVKINIDTNCITTGINLATNKPVVASSENGNVASNATDHNAKTRWEAAQKDDQWIYVDLQQEYDINKVKLSWESAYAKGYEIQVSNTPDDETSWKTVYTETNGDGNFDEAIFNPTKARYVRIKMNQAGTDYTYSLYEIGVYEARKISKPQLSLKSGTYQGNQFLSIASGTKGVQFRYTTDGSEPTEKSKLYIPGLTLTKDTNIKVKAFKKGMLASDTVSGNYVINNGVDIGDEDLYDKAPKFSVKEDEEIEEELLAGEKGASDTNELISGNLAYNKNVVVSSLENENSKQNLVDGNIDSTWSSDFRNVEDRNKEYCYVDLGASMDVNQVKLHWVNNTAPGNKYAIQVSDDEKNWKTVYIYNQANNNSDDATDVCNFDTIKARYVRMQGIKLGQGYGYALREMEVRNLTDAQPFGQNVGVDAMYEGDTYDNLHDGNMDTSTTLSGQGSFTFDLAKTYNIDRMTFDHEQAGQGTYTISYSTDGENWTKIDSSNLDKNIDLSFDAVDARYIKVDYNVEGSINVKELQVYTVGSSRDEEAKETIYNGVDAVASTNTQDAIKVLKDEDRWQADGNDQNEWIYIDLGEAKDINEVKFNWEGAYAKAYTIQVSNDASSWDDVYSTDQGHVGDDTASFATVNARYVKVRCDQRGTDWAASLYSMKAGYVEPIELDHILVGPQESKIALKDKLQLNYVFYPANATDQSITFKSSNEEVATVNAKGVVTAKKLGEATITAIAANNKTYEVKVKVTGKISKPSLTLDQKVYNSVDLSWDAIEFADHYNVYVSDKADGEYTKVNEAPITDTHYSIDQLTDGKYYYKVQACSGDADYLDSDLSRAQSIKVSAPTAIDLDVTSATVGVNQDYTIQVKTTLDPSTLSWSSDNPDVATVTNGVVHTLKPGKATITVSSGTISRTFSLTVMGSLESPVLNKTTDDNNVTLSWNAIENATNYELYRKQNNGEYQKIATTDQLSYQDKNLDPGDYSYKLVAKGSEFYADSTDSNEVSTRITKQLEAATPKATVTKNTVKLTWDKVEHASKYQILKANAEGQYEEVATVDTNSYEETGLDAGTYSYKVVVLGDEIYTTSKESEAVEATVKVEKLASVVLDAKQEGNKAKLSWQAVEHASGYEVYRKDNNGEYKLVLETNQTSFEETMTPGTHQYKVIAKGTGNYGSSDAVESDVYKVTKQLEAVTPKVAVTKNTVKLTWDKVEHASKYQILKANAEGQYEEVATVDTNSYEETGLDAGTYSYKVV